MRRNNLKKAAISSMLAFVAFLMFILLISKVIPLFGSFICRAALFSARLSLPESGSFASWFNFSNNFSEKNNSEGEKNGVSEKNNSESEKNGGSEKNNSESEKNGVSEKNNSESEKNGVSEKNNSGSEKNGGSEKNNSESEKKQENLAENKPEAKKEIPKPKEGEGLIIRKHYDAGNGNKIIKIGESAYVNNLTNLQNNVVIEANKHKPYFNITKKQEPQVLLIHTHATESYEPEEKKIYSKAAPTRSKNMEINVIKVGDEIAKKLEEAGIKTLHDKTLHDSPEYVGAYDRSNNTIKNILAANKSIKIVLDIHRDSIVNDRGERFAPVSEINGKKAAQVMIIVGCDNGTMHYPNYLQNLTFACFLQRQLGLDFPKLTRPISFKYKHYNQNLTPGSLLVEVGSESNSIDEAKYAGGLFGQSIAKALKTIQA